MKNFGELTRCTDTSGLRHFGPKTFRTGPEVSRGHFGRSVSWTLRHQCKKFRHFGTGAEVSTWFLMRNRPT